VEKQTEAWFKLRKVSDKGKDARKAAADSTKKDDANPMVKDIGEFLARGIMMIKQVSLTYQETNGTGLPGFFQVHNTWAWIQAKTLAPGYGFISGSNDEYFT
jgi:cell surface protein SprA